jgi:hypothetical protein
VSFPPARQQPRRQHLARRINEQRKEKGRRARVVWHSEKQNKTKAQKFNSV